MASIAVNLDSIDLNSIDEVRLVSEPSPDRLPAMLFLAALIHGIFFIGVTFNSALRDQFDSAISLEVTIIANPDQRIDRPDEAEYLAQASQLGGGNTSEQVRPSAPVQSAFPIDNVGQEDGQRLVESNLHEQSADEVLTTLSEQERRVEDAPRDDPRPDNNTAIALNSGNEQTLPLPQADSATLLVHDDKSRQLIISADTRESSIAAYLDHWKRRIETVGDDYFPKLGSLEGLTGSPTLEVSIDASGQLAEVIIRKSSGSKVLDQAALDILRQASPFDPFPAEVRADYDSLRFAYKWLFREKITPTTASVESASSD
jgi:protein TonB